MALLLFLVGGSCIFKLNVCKLELWKIGSHLNRTLLKLPKD